MPAVGRAFSGEISMNKNTKQVKAAKAKAEEEALNRILYWVAGGSVLEFLLLLLNRYWCHYGPKTLQLRLALENVIPVVGLVALIAAAGGAWLWVRANREGKSTTLPAILCLMGLGIGGGCFGAKFFGEPGILLMCILTLAVAVLAILFYLYQREFFLLACQGAVTLIGLWICERGLGGGKAAFCYLYVIGAVLLLLAGAVLCWKLQAGKGVLEWQEEKRRILPKDVNYAFLYGGAAVSAAVLVCALMALPVMALCAVEVAWLFVMAVYYTVKLM